jgi:hypothetical protein
MEPYQARVIDEKNQLDDKISKLGEFIDNNDQFIDLDEVDQVLLERQREVMEEYSDILGARIANFTA